MTDTSWTIETKEWGQLTVPGAIGDTLPSFSSGKSVTLTIFGDESDDEEFENLRDFVRYTNESTTSVGTDIRGKPWYQSTPHPRSKYSSPLVKVTPGTGFYNLGNWWCIIQDAIFITNSVGGNRRIEFEFYVLGDVDQYPDRELVITEFETSI